METGENFTGNKEEDLHIDNEIMRLKLSAQYGDAFKMECPADLPPDIENQFLKNVIATEDYFRNGKKIMIYEKIGKPEWKSYEILSERELLSEKERLLGLLSQHDIDLNFIHGPYSNTVVYRFITEELFQEEIVDLPVNGMRYGYIYEEFHINNEAEINEITHQFFYSWLTRNKILLPGDDAGFYFIDAKGNKLSNKEVYRKIKLFTDCYTGFQNDAYNIDAIQVDEQQDGTALGFSEGMCKYEAVLENGELQIFEGPFKIYMRRENNYWNIFYFIIPGFEW